MKAKFGYVGEKEVELAKEALIASYKLNDGSFMKKNLWFEKPHTGDYVRGYAYDDVEELLEELEDNLYTFKTLCDIDTFIQEFDYSFSDDDLTKIKTIIADGKTAYMIDNEIDDDKSYLIFNRLSDGQYMWEGTVEDAYNELNEWEGWNNANNRTELLTVGILNKIA